jgi:large conductance mechanosensitive channel
MGVLRGLFFPYGRLFGELPPPASPTAQPEGAVMKAMWEEFKTFAMKGNVIDLAIGVIIGAAFTPIVATLVANIMMPIIGYASAGVDFSALAVTPVEGVEIKYGLFINAIIQFLITAIALFFLIKAINMVRKPAAAAPAPTQSEIYLKEIRDALVKGKP